MWPSSPGGIYKKCGYNKTLRYYDASARFLNRYPSRPSRPRRPVAQARPKANALETQAFREFPFTFKCYGAVVTVSDGGEVVCPEPGP